MNLRWEKNIRLIYMTVGIIVATAALIVCFNLIPGGYWDVTGDGRFSLGQETTEWLRHNDRSIHIRLYVSKDLPRKNAALAGYADYVRRLLTEYQRSGKGLVTVSMTEVVPFTSSQTEAEKAGVKEFNLPDKKEYVYLGLGLIDEIGQTAVVPQLLPERQGELESDITRLMSVLVTDRRPKLGILSPYFRAAGQNNPLRYAENLPFVKQLELLGYEIVPLSKTTPFIPEGIDAVLVFYPLNLETEALYALDQYLMWGGKVMVMLDVLAEERFQGKEMFIGYNSGLKELLKNAGVLYREDVLVGDNSNSRELELSGRRIKYPFWLTVDEGRIAKHDAMRGIQKLFLNHSGFFEYAPQENLKTTVLFSTGENSGAMPAVKAINLTYDSLLKDYLLTDKQYPLALLVEGKFKSLFDRPIVSDSQILAEMPPFLSLPLKEGALLLVGDSDMAAAFLWDAGVGRQHDVFGAATISDNMKFMESALDYLTQSGYVTTTRKADGKPRVNISDVFYRLAAKSYQIQKKQVADELAEIKQKITAAKENIAATVLPSAKQIKDLEEQLRVEADKENELRQIAYLTEEHYHDYLFWFAVVVIGGLPLLLVALVRGIYRIYECRVKFKAGEAVK